MDKGKLHGKHRQLPGTSKERTATRRHGEMLRLGKMLAERMSGKNVKVHVK